MNITRAITLSCIVALIFLSLLYFPKVLLISHPSVVAQPDFHGELPIEVFTTSSNFAFAKPSDLLFGGFFHKLNDLPLPLRWSSLVIIWLGIMFVNLLFDSKRTSRLQVPVFLSLSCLLSIVLCLRLTQGFDEFFINLRHSYVLAHAHRYSYNIFSTVEATVDFLPFFVTGLLGLCKAPLVETAIIMSLLGNVLTVIAVYLLAKAATGHQQFALGLSLLIAVFPPLVEIGGTGFPTTLFTGVILLSIYFLFFAAENYFRLGIIGFALLTLVRTEGVILAFLFWLLLYVFPWMKQVALSTMARSIKFKTVFSTGLLMMGPFILSAILRRFFFGFWLPNPILFKSTGGDLGYLQHGFENLRATIVAFDLHYLYAFASVPFIMTISSSLRRHRLAMCFIVLVIFTFPYFIGGGDWFPMTWSRYALPFIIFTVVAAAIAVFTSIRDHWFSQKETITFYIVILFGVLSYNQTFGAAQSNIYGLVMSDLDVNTNRWDRIDKLAALGSFLKLSTPESAVIASAEVATIMYHAERDILDLLGVGNSEIAVSPLAPLREGDVLHRKHFPESIDRHMPDIIALYEPAGAGTSAAKGRANTKEELITQVQTEHFGGGMKYVAAYRVGSLEHLKTLGYHHVIVDTPNVYFNYFVKDQIYEEHRQKLIELGFSNLGLSRMNL